MAVKNLGKVISGSRACISSDSSSLALSWTDAQRQLLDKLGKRKRESRSGQAQKLVAYKCKTRRGARPCFKDQLLLDELIELAKDQYTDIQLLREQMALYNTPVHPSSLASLKNADSRLQAAYLDLYDQSCAVGRYVNASAERLEAMYTEYGLANRVQTQKVAGKDLDSGTSDYISPEDYFVDRSPPGTAIPDQFRDRTPMKELDEMVLCAELEMANAKILIEKNKKVVTFAEIDKTSAEKQFEEIVALALHKQALLAGDPDALDHSVTTISFSSSQSSCSSSAESSYLSSASEASSESSYSDELSSLDLESASDGSRVMDFSDAMSTSSSTVSGVSHSQVKVISDTLSTTTSSVKVVSDTRSTTTSSVKVVSDTRSTTTSFGSVISNSRVKGVSDTLPTRADSKVSSTKSSIEVSAAIWQQVLQYDTPTVPLSSHKRGTDSDSLSSDPGAPDYLFDSSYRADPRVAAWWEAEARQLRELADDGALLEEIAELTRPRGDKQGKVDREGFGAVRNDGDLGKEKEEEEEEWVMES